MAKKQDKHTPSDNRRQKSQHSNMKDADNPKTSGSDFDEVRKDKDDRLKAKNESGKYNSPRRRTGDQGGGEQDKTR
jgi:hypothetical protein